MVFFERFQDVVVGPAANRFQRRGNIMDGGHHDDGNLRVELANPVQQLDAVHLRHDHVAQNQVWRLFLDQILGGAPIAHRHALVAFRLQHGRNHFSNRFLVIHYKYLFQLHVLCPRRHYTGQHREKEVLLPSQKIAC